MGRFEQNRTIRAPGARRRFEPSSDAQDGPVLTEVGEDRKQPSYGRETLGHLVAVRRAELGLTQAELAVRMGVSQAAVARIEEGHPPSTDALRQLAKVFPPVDGNDELLHWVEHELHWRSPQFRRQGARAPRESLDLRWGFLNGRWLWGGLALAGLSAVLIAAVVIVAGQSSDDGGSAPEPAQVVSAPPAAPVAVEPPKKPQKAKNAQNSKKADGNSAPVADSDESSAPTSSDSGSSSDAESPPVSAPVATPSPPPSSSQSNGPRPGIKHGIQAGGP